MPSADRSDGLAPAAFRGEPGEASPDAAGGWSADDAREYREYRLRAEAIKQVADCADELGFGIREIVRSELPGTHGNIEYVLWISAGQAKNRSQWNSKIEDLAKEGK